MNIREQFNTQWRDIEDVVLSDARRQIKFHGKVNKDDLTMKLEQETSKWQRGVLARGILYKEIAGRSNSDALLFAEAAKGLRFSEPKTNCIPSSWWINAVILVITMILAIVLHYHTEFSIIEKVFYPILTYVVITAICQPIKNKRRDFVIAEIMSDLEEQMQRMRHSLEEYL